ncbi:hypothetical protein CHGG_07957 [Chaetomium globosum CBS 148.51]|uniref:DASH complex subunit DAD2 n=1 Tax=Chaetomium globosum (strain ATCC 6205 / CBS 148.51 / DSM 1962 / NBRC 6347 / NRRL 1970) TaxID=306901 RepID=Q2GVP7_CHAGB|nr:uncharacterized protein CHGG_07957 [Chaetomium globosum CBS 148.51]EAQ86704.1 hypothetical protein CHGG_07957 [Chaetomium globosum CBS 148.51]
MSGFPSRPLASHMRQPSLSANVGGQSPALVARVNEKKAELENLKELRHLSAEVATQMEALEQKLATLSDGTEAKLPKPAADAVDRDETPLPQTLVRIPTEHAPALQAHAEGAAEEASG